MPLYPARSLPKCPPSGLNCCHASRCSLNFLLLAGGRQQPPTAKSLIEIENYVLTLILTAIHRNCLTTAPWKRRRHERLN